MHRHEHTIRNCGKPGEAVSHTGSMKPLASSLEGELQPVFEDHFRTVAEPSPLGVYGKLGTVSEARKSKITSCDGLDGPTPASPVLVRLDKPWH